jgi:cellulase/cellobiase CelA1
VRYTEREWRFVAATVVLAVVAAALLGVYLMAGRADAPDRSMRVGLMPASTAPASVPSRSTGAPTVKAGYFLRNSWRGGFNAELVVTNLASQPLAGWTVQLQMADDVRVTQAWSAESKQVATGVTLSSQPWNTYLAPGASVHFGFAATGSAAAPRSCTVNGTPC